MLIPPAATACQLWAGVPGTHVAVPNPAVGTFQLTSPTSVEPIFWRNANGSISMVDSKGLKLPNKDLRNVVAESPLRFVVFDTAQAFQVAVDHFRQNVVAKQREIAVHDLV